VMTVRPNGRVGLGTKYPSQILHVVGNIYATGSITPGSSRELKDEIEELSLEKAREAFKQLQPVTFRYKADEERDLQVGFIAEDVPELVSVPGRKGVSSMDIVAVLTKVLQEKDREIENLKVRVTELEVLKQEVAEIKALVSK